MTSTERHELRYQRRRAKRMEKKLERVRSLGSLEDIFTFSNLYQAGYKCCKNVRWKQSVQNFELHLFSGTALRREKVLNGTWKSIKCSHFTLSERGKTRIIDAPHITDRQIQKLETEMILKPCYQPSMIEDNGASQIGKGLHWHFKRLKKHLSDHYRRYGREGGIAIIDLKGFFPNAPRAEIYKRHKDLICVPELVRFADKVVTSVPQASPGRGLPLGVEPSQQEMVCLPSSIDNYIKCQLGVHGAGHYMDDYYMVHHDLEELKVMMNDVISKFEAMGIPVNRNKSKVIPFTRSFKWCKAKFTMKESGKIIMNGNRDGMKRIRRKFKLFREQYDRFERPITDVIQLYRSEIAYYRNYNDNGRILTLRKLYRELFGKIFEELEISGY